MTHIRKILQNPDIKFIADSSGGRVTKLTSVLAQDMSRMIQDQYMLRSDFDEDTCTGFDALWRSLRNISSVGDMQDIRIDNYLH